MEGRSKRTHSEQQRFDDLIPEDCISALFSGEAPIFIPESPRQVKRPRQLGGGEPPDLEVEDSPLTPLRSVPRVDSVTPRKLPRRRVGHVSPVSPLPPRPPLLPPGLEEELLRMDSIGGATAVQDPMLDEELLPQILDFRLSQESTAGNGISHTGDEIIVERTQQSAQLRTPKETRKARALIAPSPPLHSRFTSPAEVSQGWEDPSEVSPHPGTLLLLFFCCRPDSQGRQLYGGGMEVHLCVLCDPSLLAERY